MKEEVRTKIIKNEAEQKKTIAKKENIRKEIDELVCELLNSDIVKRLKYKGNEYKETAKVIELLKQQNIDIRNDANFCCGHPIVYLVGYRKHNASNRVVTAPKEEAEYAQVRCLECKKLLYTLDKKSDLNNFDKMIFIQHYARKQSDPEYQERPVLKTLDGINFSEVYEEYQKLLIDESEEIVVQKILKKYGNN